MSIIVTFVCFIAIVFLVKLIVKKKNHRLYYLLSQFPSHPTYIGNVHSSIDPFKNINKALRKWIKNFISSEGNPNNSNPISVNLDRLQRTALHLAVHQGNLDLVNMLLENGASLDVVDSEGFTPCLRAVKFGHVELVKRFCEEKLNKNQTNSDGNTAIHLAALYGFYSIADLLLKNGFPLDIPNKAGIYPIHIAVQNKSVSIVKLLLEFGANVDVQEHHQRSPPRREDLGSEKDMNLQLHRSKNMQKQISKNNSSMPDSSELNVSEKIISMVFGFMVSQAISVVARLGIADLLQEGPRSAADLAEATNSHPQSLYRVMRALASEGIFHELEDKTFSLTSMGNLLKKNPLDGIGAYSMYLCSDWNWPVSGSLDYSVRTGEPAFEKVYNQPFFSYLEEHPYASQMFNDGMTSLSAAAGEAVVDAYDYSGIKRLIDVGGGHGYLLASIVKRYPEITGILFDSPSVIKGAQSIPNACDTDTQFELVRGDFFEKIDAKGDTIIMKHILHDWDEQSSLKILRNCHAALPKNGKLLVVEMVIPGSNQPAIGKWLDLRMLVFLHSCERTEEEYSTLFSKAGFRLTRVFPSTSPLSVIEAIRL